MRPRGARSYGRGSGVVALALAGLLLTGCGNQGREGANAAAGPVAPVPAPPALPRPDPRILAGEIQQALVVTNPTDQAGLTRLLQRCDDFLATTEGDPDDSIMHIARAAVLDRAGRHDDAVAALQDAVRVGGETPFGRAAVSQLERVRVRDSREGLVGQPVPDFQVLLTSGARRRPTDYAGQVLVLDFWASWCAPCLREIPGLRQMSQDLGPRGLSLLSLSVDDDERAWLARLAQIDAPWDQARVGGEVHPPRDSVAGRFFISGVPTIFVVDRKGVVRHVGLLGDPLRQAVEALLDEE